MKRDNETVKTRYKNLESEWTGLLVGLRGDKPPEECATHHFPHLDNGL